MVRLSRIAWLYDTTAFLHGRFAGKQYTAAEMFGRLSDPDAISELERYFEDKGYICVNDELSVMYQNEYANVRCFPHWLGEAQAKKW